MEKLIKELVDIAVQCEKAGLQKSASNIDNISQSLLNIKTAQYLGIQGYWVRNERCWSNCYRNKRTNKPKLSAQQVWQECQTEYAESINDDKSGWEKYAEDNTDEVMKKFASKGLEKEASKVISSEQKFFHKTIQSKLDEGIPFEVAMYSTIEESNDRYINSMLDEAEKTLIVAKELKENKQDELSKKLAQLSFSIIKEAQIGGDARNRNWLGKGWDWLTKNDKTKMMERIQQINSDVTNSYYSIIKGTNRDPKFITNQMLQLGEKFNRDINEIANLASKTKEPDAINTAQNISQLFQKWYGNYARNPEIKMQIAGLREFGNALRGVLTQQMSTMRDIQTTPGATPATSADQGIQGAGAVTGAPGDVPGITQVPGSPTADTSALSAGINLQQVIKYVDSLVPGSQDWNQLVNYIQVKSKGAQGKLLGQGIKGPVPGGTSTGVPIQPIPGISGGVTTNF